MGLSDEQMSYCPTLTREEMARMHPCKKAKCVMMSADSSPTMQASLPTTNYVELPDEPRPGKITPSSPLSNSTNNSTPSPRDSKSNGGTSTLEADEEEAIEEAVPISVSTLPSPEPKPELTRNGYKDHHDRVDGAIKNNFKPTTNRDIDEDSCLIKCVYFTQQCCECVVL